MKVYVLMEDRFHAPSFIYGVFKSEDKAFEERARILSELEFPFDESFSNNAFIHEFTVKDETDF